MILFYSYFSIHFIIHHRYCYFLRLSVMFFSKSLAQGGIVYFALTAPCIYLVKIT